MTSYRVTWTLDLEADSYLAAAEEALAIQRDPSSTALHFTVEDTECDRTELVLLTSEATR